MTKRVPADSFSDAQLECRGPDVVSHQRLPPEGKPTLSSQTGEDPIGRLPELRTATPGAKSSNQVWIEGNRLLRCFSLTRADGLGTNGQENKSLLSVTQPASESIDFGRQKHLRLRPPLCALADEANGIAVDEVVPPRWLKRTLIRFRILARLPLASGRVRSHNSTSTALMALILPIRPELWQRTTLPRRGNGRQSRRRSDPRRC